MNEENQDWQAPPLPVEANEPAETPKMSLIQTLTDIFFEPGKVFEDLRISPFPRLVVPLLLCVVLIMGYSFALSQKLGPERIMKEQLQSKWMEQIPEETKKKMLEDAKTPTTIGLILSNVGGAVAVLVIFVIIGLVYWGACLAFGGNGNLWHALAVNAYASFPPVIVSMIGSIIVLFLKAPEDISFFQSQSGLLKLNPTLLLDVSPVVNALLSRFDLLVLWGMFLATVGMVKCFKISSGSAWAISILFWLIGTSMAALGGMFAG